MGAAAAFVDGLEPECGVEAGGVLGEGVDGGVHGLLDAHEFEGVDAVLAGEVAAVADEAGGEERAALKQDGDSVAGGAGEQDGQKEAAVVGELDGEHGGGEGCADGGGEKGRHADDGPAAGRELGEEVGEGRAEGSADHEERGEDAAGGV